MGLPLLLMYKFELSGPCYVLLWDGAKQPIHCFPKGMGLDMQQGTSVWVGLPNIVIVHVSHQ